MQRRRQAIHPLADVYEMRLKETGHIAGNITTLKWPGPSAYI